MPIIIQQRVSMKYKITMEIELSTNIKDKSMSKQGAVCDLIFRCCKE